MTDPPERQQSEPPAQGPLVWLHMDQRELDEAYSQANFAPEMELVLARYGTNSAAVRARLGAPMQVSYGATPSETLDLFKARQSGAPVHMFVHGGGWHRETAADYAFAAECFVAAGVHYLVPDFSWVQDADDGLHTLVAQLQHAVEWVYRNAGSFGGDPNQIYVSGHSSGAHLAGVLLTTDWEVDYGLPADVLKGGLCCSGMFDLAPVRHSYRNNHLAITAETEQALSPIRHIDRLNAPLILAYGSRESPEFIRQAREFASAVADSGKPVTTLVAENFDHFTVIETLASPLRLLGRAALDQIFS